MTGPYLRSLESKERALRCGLDRLGYGDVRAQIYSAPQEEGFRTRCKLKIYRHSETCRICGTDPLRGEVELKDMLWILPPWVRGEVLQLAKVLQARQTDFPVDGCELKLAHGRPRAYLTLSVPRGVTRDFAPLAGAVMSCVPNLTGVAVPSQGLSFGDPWIRHEINGRELHAHHAAFFQSHPGLTPRLLDIVQEMMGSAAEGGVLDLYCGVGLLSLLALSTEFGIVGVDSAPRAVESAEINAARLGSSHSRFLCESVEDFVATASIDHGTVVLLDPPRSGIPGQVIRRIARFGPRHVCQVSCFVETAFRDLEVWKTCGYALREMAALDMFPFMEYLETVSRLEYIS